MIEETTMNRRRFLWTSATLLTGTVVAGKLAQVWHVQDVAEQDVLAQLRAMQGRVWHSSGAWTPAQVFAHLAQSIEFSLDGYPEAKPAWFQHSAGTLAYSAFAAAGAMRHNLAEPIPGAPSLLGEMDTEASLERLISAWQQFEQHTGALAPHFAYGALDHRQYRLAHWLHLRNHLQELHS